MSKIGIMQPYFFPYLGYFSIIKHVDTWVFFDTPQYIKKGWVNRNRILKMGGGDKYIGINIVKSEREASINSIQISSDFDYTKVIKNNLDYYKNVKAPYYYEVTALLDEIFSLETDNLSELLIHAIKLTCNYLKIDTDFLVFSEMDFKINKEMKAGDWAPEITKYLGAKDYFNPPGGRAIFNNEDFHSNNLNLFFLENKLSSYPQRNLEFVPGLSIIDVMMFNDIEKTHVLLDDYIIVKG